MRSNKGQRFWERKSFCWRKSLGVPAQLLRGTTAPWTWCAPIFTLFHPSEHLFECWKETSRWFPDVSGAQRDLELPKLVELPRWQVGKCILEGKQEPSLSAGTGAASFLPWQLIEPLLELVGRWGDVWDKWIPLDSFQILSSIMSHQELCLFHSYIPGFGIKRK